MRIRKLVGLFHEAYRSWLRTLHAPLGIVAGGGTPPPPRQGGTREIGIEVAFSPSVTHRGIRANRIYAALLEVGEVLAFHPNFVVAPDEELGYFWLALRTEHPWSRVEAAVREAVDPGELLAVRQVEPEKARGPSPATAGAGTAADHIARDAGHVGETPELSTTEVGDGQRTIRVDLERLEVLSNLIGELAVEKAQLVNLVTRLEAVSEGEGRRLVHDLRRSVAKLAAVSGQLQDLSTELRMVPVGTLFRRYVRVVRELSGVLGKPLRLLREGEDTMVDKAIVEAMAAPLLHLVRNAADHGIEPPEERRRFGKPEVGHITLRAYDQGDEVVIEVVDDGRGLDVDSIRARAVERGLLTAEMARSLPDSQVLQLVFRPGFSTASQVTDISGRGVGMDVVRASVERLRGTVQLCTEPGRGTRVVIRLPLTVSVVQVLFVQVGDETLAVPMQSLRGMARVHEGIRVLGGSAILYQDRLLPVLELAKAWWGRESGGNTALLVQARDQELALVVDRPLGMGEVVIKPLGDYLGRLPGVAGAAILADGRVALVLDPQTLVPHSLEEVESVGSTAAD